MTAARATKSASHRVYSDKVAFDGKEESTKVYKDRFYTPGKPWEEQEDNQ